MLHALLVGAAALLHAPALPMRACAVRMCVAEECDAEEKYCTTVSGIKFLDDKIGEGEEATAEANSVVRVGYVASLLSTGDVLGSTQDLRFALGDNKLAFWEEAIEGMRVGGMRRLLVPPSAKLGLKSGRS